MKKVPCSYVDCGERRIHHEEPDTKRGTQFIEVPDTFDEALNKAFCSITCAVMAGEYSLKDGWKKRNS